MFSRRRFLSLCAVPPLATFLAAPALAGNPYVFNTHGVAISGYDPVAYFTEGKPVQGIMEFAVKWEGAMWVFASMKNAEAFMGNPRAYAPKYGGYCAYAMSKGAVATTEPDAWTIFNDQLYLNYNTSVRGIWRDDILGNVALADGHWPSALM